jgi:hypothetical protein
LLPQVLELLIRVLVKLHQEEDKRTDAEEEGYLDGMKDEKKT